MHNSAHSVSYDEWEPDSAQWARRFFADPRARCFGSCIARVGASWREGVDGGAATGDGRGRRVVMEGRDIGTKVFPDADSKIFLDADPVVRERRRMEQQKIKNDGGGECGPGRTCANWCDRTRAASPLKAAEDAVVIDSTELGEDEALVGRNWRTSGRMICRPVRISGSI